MVWVSPQKAQTQMCHLLLELRSCVKFEKDVPNSPYGLCGCKVTLNSIVTRSVLAVCLRRTARTCSRLGRTVETAEHRFWTVRPKYIVLSSKCLKCIRQPIRARCRLEWRRYVFDYFTEKKTCMKNNKNNNNNNNKTVEDCKIKETVRKIPTLSDEKVNNIEEKITLEEATRALKNMKYNKNPGTELLFLKVFETFFFFFFWRGGGGGGG